MTDEYVESQVNISKATEESRIEIRKEQLEKVRKHIEDKFNIIDARGNIDLDKCQLAVGYALNTYTNYNGVLLKEKHLLAEIEEQLKLARSGAYNDIKMRKIKYDLDSKGMNITLEGHVLVKAKKLEYDKQAAYVEFWENTVKQVSFYANSIKVIMQRAEIKGRYGE